MEGRDIGSVVLKDADLKFFLTASVETRAARRIKQLSLKGQKVNEEEILNNIIERDKRDSEREHTPLIKPENAIEIDTSFLTIEEVAKYLRVSERTVYDWAQKGEIPSGKIGTVWRFKKSEIEKWVNERLSAGTKPVTQNLQVQVKNILSPDACYV